MSDRSIALNLAKQLYADYRTADIANLFHNGPEPVKADYCYRHGWIIVCGHSFNDEDLTGYQYDSTQGGWAFI